MPERDGDANAIHGPSARRHAVAMLHADHGPDHWAY